MMQSHWTLMHYHGSNDRFHRQLNFLKIKITYRKDKICYKVTTYKIPLITTVCTWEKLREIRGREILQENVKNKSIFANVFSFRGLRPPDPLPQTPHYTLVLRIHHGPLLVPITKTRKVATLMGHRYGITERTVWVNTTSALSAGAVGR